MYTTCSARHIVAVVGVNACAGPLGNSYILRIRGPYLGPSDPQGGKCSGLSLSGRTLEIMEAAEAALAPHLVDPGASYYRARYYDSTSGRFLSEDPAGFQGGPNRYTYALGTPTNLVDPSGRISSVTQIGNTITVTASITLYGPNATAALAQQWEKDINSLWNNYGNNFTHGNCVVKFNVRVIADPLQITGIRPLWQVPLKTTCMSFPIPTSVATLGTRHFPIGYG